MMRENLRVGFFAADLAAFGSFEDAVGPAALRDGLGDREAAVAREISKRFEETVTGTLSELAARYEPAPPKGEIVIVVGPPGEPEAASDADVDAALRDAMTTLSPSRAAAEVAARLGLPKRQVYERAQQLK